MKETGKCTGSGSRSAATRILAAERERERVRDVQGSEKLQAGVFEQEGFH